MTFDDLRQSWQESRPEPVPPEQRAELISRVTRRVERLSSAFVRRDWIETVAAGLGIWFFAGAFLRFDHPVVRAGAAILVGSCAFIIYYMHRTRLIRRPASPDATVHDYCTVELDRITRQIQLLESIVWWYISPVIVGVNVFYFGVKGWSLSSLIYLAVTLLLGWGIYLLNTYGAKAELIPARDELSRLLNELSDATESSVT